MVEPVFYLPTDESKNGHYRSHCPLHLHRAVTWKMWLNRFASPFTSLLRLTATFQQQSRQAPTGRLKTATTPILMETGNLDWLWGPDPSNGLPCSFLGSLVSPWALYSAVAVLPNNGARETVTERRDRKECLAVNGHHKWLHNWCSYKCNCHWFLKHYF